jgi:hypothetical protein
MGKPRGRNESEHMSQDFRSLDATRFHVCVVEILPDSPNTARNASDGSGRERSCWSLEEIIALLELGAA